MLSEIPIRGRYKRVIQIELNEIAKPVIDSLIAEAKLPTFQKINQEWAYYETESENRYEALEPWIQWTTVHTGKTLAEHQIFRLSDAPQLKCKQIWEELSERDIQSAIICSMNARRGTTEGGIFIPDPWAKHNETYPDSLAPLWQLVSKKVQGHAADPLTVTELMRGIRACMTFPLPVALYAKIAYQLISQQFSPSVKWRLPAIFDHLLFAIFNSLLQSTRFGFYTLFLNAVAHYQHHYWRNFDASPFNSTIQTPDCKATHNPMAYGYDLYDRLLARLLKNKQADTLIVIASGLSQTPYLAKEKEGGMNYYRLRNHEHFARSLGLGAYPHYPLMSRDWQIAASDSASLARAKDILLRVTVKGQPLFAVSQNAPNSLFIETAVTSRIDAGEFIMAPNGEPLAKFGDTFVNIAIKSGHHSGKGSLWCSENRVFAETPTVPLASLYSVPLQALLN